MTSFLTWLYNQKSYIQKLFALACTALLILLGVIFIQVFFNTTNALVSENISKRELLGRLSSVAQLKSSLRTSEISAKAYKDIFLRGETVASAGANLQSIVEGMAQANNVAISSTTNLPVRDQAGVELIGLKVVLIGSLEKVHKVIFGIETARPPLLVGDIVVQSMSNQNKSITPKIAVDINIFGAKKPELAVSNESEDS